MPVDISFNAGITRASLVFRHPTGNILTLELMRQIRAALEDLLDSKHLRLLTIEGAGADFCFGASVAEHTREHMRIVLPEMHALIRDLISLPCRPPPLSAAVASAAASSWRSRATTSLRPKMRRSACPRSSWERFRRPRACCCRGAWAWRDRRARFSSGEPQCASFWRDAGWWHGRRPPPACALKRSLVRSHAGAHSAEALRHAVRVARMPIERAIGEELDEVERLYLLDLGVTHDAAEGVQAFLEKRSPALER
jgi:enoyl-CoA hydratase/carnithine racemase